MGQAMSLVLHVGGPVAVGGIIGTVIAPDVLSDWYKNLNKPKWQPPAFLFGPVWTTLYAMMGYAAYRVQQAGGGPLPLGLYGAQLALNLLWSPLFFKRKDLPAAAVDITALVGVLGATIFEFNKVDPIAAQLLLPYLGWTSFATALTYWIWNHNPKPVVEKPKAGGKAA